MNARVKTRLAMPLRTMKCALVVLTVASQSSACTRPDEARVATKSDRAERQKYVFSIVDPIVFLKEPPSVRQDYGEGKWKNGPDWSRLDDLYSDDMPDDADAIITCKLVEEGRLENCAIGLEPDTRKLRRLFEELSKNLVVDLNSVQEWEGNIDDVSFSISVENRAGVNDRFQPCFSYSCTIVPPPPPPPPPPKGDGPR